MERWYGLVRDINVTCADLGQNGLQLPGTLTLICSYAHTTSSTYVKGRVTALNTMVSVNYQGLATIYYVST